MLSMYLPIRLHITSATSLRRNSLETCAVILNLLPPPFTPEHIVHDMKVTLSFSYVPSMVWWRNQPLYNLHTVLHS